MASVPSCCSEIYDSFWVLSALKSIVDRRDFAQYEKASQLVSLLCKSLLPTKILKDSTRFELEFLLRFVGILSKIGREETRALVQILRQQLGTDVTTDQSEVIADLDRTFTSGIFRQARLFVLKLLISHPRVENFARNKFPDTFLDVLDRLELKTSAFIEDAWCAFPLSDLELWERGIECPENDKALYDPGFLLYTEFFPKGKLVSEEGLLKFLGIYHSHALSLTPPSFQGLFSQSQCFRGASLPLTASDDLFTSDSVCPSSETGYEQGFNDKIDIKQRCPKATVEPVSEDDDEESNKTLLAIKKEVINKQPASKLQIVRNFAVRVAPMTAEQVRKAMKETEN